MMLILVGQRRVGKSFILKSLSDWLHRDKPQANVLFIDKDFDSYSIIKTSEDLYSYDISYTYLTLKQLREFDNLQAIRDSYPKYVVTMEDITGSLKEYPGIRHIHMRDFLKHEF